MKFRKVFHLTPKKNVRRILKEGLKPLANRRPKELQLVDHAFDLVADNLGLSHRRSGMFAYMRRNQFFFDDNMALIEGKVDGRSTIFQVEEPKEGTIPIREVDLALLELDVDPNTSLVLHSAWLDLAWGVVDGVFRRIHAEYKDLFYRESTIAIYEILKPANTPEGILGDVLDELARLYWTTAVMLKDYNKTQEDLLNQQVHPLIIRFPGLLPGSPHEVCLGLDHIPKQRITKL